MADGWIKFYRKFLDWEWYQDGSMVRLFLHLLLNANHKAKRWQGIDVLPGQVVTGRHALAQELGMTERTIRTCLKKLKTTSELTIKTTNRFSIITIAKWADYQCRSDNNDQPNDQPDANKRPASDHQATTNKKGKNVKKEKKEEKNTYGSQFHRVKLSEAEYHKLTTAFGEQRASEMIEGMDEYLESKGDPYSSHYATLLTWERRKGGSNGRGPGIERKVEGKASSARDLGDGETYPCDLEVTE